MYGYIYLTTNTVNNKIYVGKHKSSIFNSHYYGSGKLIRLAIAKYGIDAFGVKLLCTCDSLEDLNRMERFYIQEFKSNDLAVGYNISQGGDGGNTTGGRICIHLGDSHKFIYPEELPQYVALGYAVGHSEESISRARCCYPDRRGPNGSFWGKHHTESAKKLIGAAAKGRPGYGDDNIARKPEVRRKISEKAKLPNNYFKTHSFYYINNGEVELHIVRDDTPVPEGFVVGRLPHCWVHNEVKECCIFVKDVDTYLSQGFVRGRISKPRKRRGS